MAIYATRRVLNFKIFPNYKSSRSSLLPVFILSNYFYAVSYSSSMFFKFWVGRISISVSKGKKKSMMKHNECFLLLNTLGNTSAINLMEKEFSFFSKNILWPAQRHSVGKSPETITK